MKVLFALLLVAPFLLLGGCGMMSTPMAGVIYTDVKYPSYYDGADTLGPGEKTGTAMAQNFLFLVGIGDASVQAACKAGGISKIHTVDHHGWSILGLYSKWTTIVTGK
ncbi:MAG: TRL-like family protein [Planctomycetes bacterium]|jgi:hypothetical protein|nr:TRL-like family protein [Planctomycetota bacterium]